MLSNSGPHWYLLSCLLQASEVIYSSLHLDASEIQVEVYDTTVANKTTVRAVSR
jgi:hypothetical protein